jgi:hypothetical protein
MALKEYKRRSKFTGKIHGVTVDVSGNLIKDHEAETRIAMARQLEADGRRGRRRQWSAPP